MTAPLAPERQRITIAILALGGQGGGVLADWIIDLAEANGFVAQGTSVPGVAQRTGSTVYYIELIRKSAPGANHPAPVLAMMPAPGDVDVVIASELMEAGRAILRGFVTDDRTVLIGSTHRIYAISEKSAPGDGTGASERIIDAARRRARRFVGFDMDRAATASGSVISSVMFGALAGSGALPFDPDRFEDAIRAGGKAVSANLKGFAAGRARAEGLVDAVAAAERPPEPTTPAGHALADRIAATVPAPARALAIEGVRRLMDYQDARYAILYLDRLTPVAALDDGRDHHRLTRDTARSLALWMAYEDTIRVADLKIRATRSQAVADEVRLTPGQVMSVTEYMHPRFQEVCETLPAPIGRAILARAWAQRLLAPLFARGRRVRTTGLRWFVVLRLLAAMRVLRRSTLRYALEDARIEEWLATIRSVAREDVALASEIAAAQLLVKGYSDTLERGLARFETVVAAAMALKGRADAAERVRRMRDAALADETGCALQDVIADTAGGKAA